MARRALIPPALGVALGVLVGLYDKGLVLPPEVAPLGWLYLAIEKLGAAAVPVNFVLLGAALASPPPSLGTSGKRLRIGARSSTLAWAFIPTRPCPFFAP